MGSRTSDSNAIEIGSPLVAPEESHRLEQIEEAASGLLRADKDLKYKLLLKHWLERTGYHVFLEVPLYVPEYTDVYREQPVTDLDVFGVRFEPDFRPYLVVAECKTSSRQKPVETLLKFAGIRAYVGCEKAILVRSKMPRSARMAAERLGLKALSEADLTRLLESCGWWDESLSATLLSSYVKERNMLEQARSHFPIQIRFVQRDFWGLPHRRNILSMFAALEQVPSWTPAQSEHQFVLLASAEKLAIALMDVCRYVLSVAPDDPVGAIRDYLVGGPRERVERERLFRLIREKLGLELSEAPSYFDHLAEVVVSLIRNPSHAVHTPSVLRRLRLALAVKDPEYPVGTIEAEYGRTALKLAKDIINLLIKGAAVPKAVAGSIYQV
ncbi:MAG: hypothetical protein AB1609_23675 [Bacillota bacterium]